MSNNKYVLVSQTKGEKTDFIDILPALPTDTDSMSWREAKKRVRAYYLNKAATLRSVTEKDYFNNA